MKIFKKYFRPMIFTVLLGLSFPDFAISQSADSISVNQPYESTIRNGLFIRGKAIGGFFLEDWWTVNLCGGLEYRFRSNHSIGVDYVFLEHFNERDTFDHVTWTESSFGFTQYDLRNNFILDYRYYNDMKTLKNGNHLSFYSAVFLRHGNRRIFNEVGWKYGENDIIYAKYYFYDLGLAFGVHYAFGDSGFGFDSNLGVFARSRKAHEEVYHYASPIQVNDWTDRVKVSPILRFNLYYLFGSRKFRKNSGN